MKILIDTVYQKVLMLANKEQRGYITPQEFNLFADMAQMEIFEQYFYDLSQLSRVHGNHDEYGDIKSNLQEKISIFEKTMAMNNGYSFAGNDIYRIGSVEYSGTVVEEIQQKELAYISDTPKLKPKYEGFIDNLLYYTRNNYFHAFPSAITGPFNITYIRRPSKPSWTYVVVNGKAMYDPDNASLQNFDLHSSEEMELVYKILKFAGVSMKRGDVVQSAQGLEIAQIQQEKQ